MSLCAVIGNRLDAAHHFYDIGGFAFSAIALVRLVPSAVTADDNPLHLFSFLTLLDNYSVTLLTFKDTAKSFSL